MENDQISERKSDHIRINLQQDVSSALTTGLEQVSFINEALPEFNFEDIDCSTRLFGKGLRLPLLISSMTGGTEQAGNINFALAEAAQEKQVALGLGSMRAALNQADAVPSFQVRKYAPKALLFANFGAVQLNYGYGITECRKIIDLSEADALILHLNPLQEALQVEGDTRFSNLLPAIAEICKQIPVPVIVKEVGWGISAATARKLFGVGVTAIDIAGAGGTSWSQVEMHRMQDPKRAHVAAAFRGWGIPTIKALKDARSALPYKLIFASGGLRNGVDLAKVLALGAKLGGFAGPFLQAAAQSTQAVIDTIDEIELGLKISMFACGAKDIVSLNSTRIWEHS